MTERLLTTNELADLYRCTAKTIRLKVREGVLPEPIRFGPRGHLRFSAAEVERFLTPTLRDPTVDVARSSAFPAREQARPDPAFLPDDEGDHDADAAA